MLACAVLYVGHATAMKPIANKKEKSNMQLEVVAMGIAQAIATSGTFRADDQKRALGYIATNSEAEHLVENIGRIGNVSAVYQELVKGGIIKGTETDSALCRAVKNAQAILAKHAEAKAATMSQEQPQA